MVVSYQAEVATYKHGRFIKLLLRWKASVFKLVWFDMMILLVFYYSLNLIYIYALNSQQKEVFEALVAYCQIVNSIIPLSFVLGFFVSQIVMRWWKQCTSLPWPDPVAVFVSTLIRGENDTGRIISPSVKKRFATYEKLVEVGLLTETELTMFNYWDNTLPKVSNYWVPIVWVSNVIVRAQKEGMILDENGVQSLLLCVNNIRTDCLHLLQYDFMNIPLVYTQTVALAFYAYFLGAVIGHQWTENMIFANFPLQKYFPALLMLQFLFYMGWIKVAEVMIAPFGEDDDDFELNWVIDRNITVSYAIVDEMHQRHPELLKDAYWDQIYPDQLPYHGVKKEEMPAPSTYHVEDMKNTGLLTIFQRKDHGTITPASSIELNVLDGMMPKRNKIHFGLNSSESSILSTSRIVQFSANTDLQKDQLSEDEYEEADLEEVSEEDGDLFEQLKEERERQRSERVSIKYIPVKVNKLSARSIRSPVESTNLSSDMSYQSTIYDDLSTANSGVTLADLGTDDDADSNVKKPKNKK